MADKLLVVLANANLEHPPELVPPLLQATVAAAMEFEVEILLVVKMNDPLVRHHSS